MKTLYDLHCERFDIKKSDPTKCGEFFDLLDDGNPIKIGGKALDTLPNDVTANDRTNRLHNLKGFAGALLCFNNRSDTFTVTGNGVTIDATMQVPKYYSLQITSTGAVATAWDVRLEGSNDNVNFTQISQHTNVTGDGVVVFQSSAQPVLFYRARCAGLTLGTATNIISRIVGVQ